MSVKISTALPLLLLAVTLSSCQVKKISKNPDFLWNTINNECVPNQKKNGNPEPCAFVEFDKTGTQGWVAYKDYRGVLHYLLMPATKITGIESPEILTEDSPNYFYQAWEARRLMSERAKKKIDDYAISFSINAQTHRSQNQLHIHISCNRPDVQDVINQNEKSVGPTWAAFPAEMAGHKWWARRITADQLKKQDAFKYLNNDFADAKGNMYRYGLAMVAVKNAKGEPEFLLLAMLGHSEDIQDHSCKLVM
jgi:CDP-diacylglycerol pyrophosphatase